MNIYRGPTRRWISAGLLFLAFVCAPQLGRAQCAPSSNGGVAQNGPPPCTISSNLTVGYGTAVTATNSANVTIANGVVLGSAGQAMSASNATIIANGVAISWSNGYGGSLVQASNGGLIQFNPGSMILINNAGYGAPLLSASGSGSRIIADGLTISFPTNGIIGAAAQNGGSVQISNSALKTPNFYGGGGNAGLWATGTGSTLSASNVTVSLVNGGGNDVGVKADSGGHVTFTGGSVSVPGNGGGEFGLQAMGSGSLITASGVSVEVSGGGGDAGVNAANGAGVAMTGGSVSVSNGAGGLLQNGGAVTMTGTDVAASGNGSYGFLFNSGGANTLNYSNGTITAGGASFSVQGATANVNLSGAIATTNNNTLLETRSSGNTTFNAQGSILQGVISTDSSSASTVNLTQDTIWTMSGNSTVTNLTNDPSEIIFTPPSGNPQQLSSYKTLTVMNYFGSGGILGLNTYLGSDGSPSDQLVINGGAATGFSLLRITNTTGPGAETKGDGILVVNAMNGATTAPGAFGLEGEVREGPFDYDLFRGGLAGGLSNDWFLRSDFVVPPGPIPGPIPIDPLPIDPLPPDPPPDPLPPGVYPIIGPELATYGVIQPIARQIGLATLGTLHDRVGDTYEPDCGEAPAPTAASFCWPSAWARGFAQQIDNRYRAYADPRANGSLGGFQGGVDLLRGSSIAGHFDRAGLYFGFGVSSATVDGLVTNPAATAYSLTQTGKLNLDGYSGGAYWTHVGPGGWYLDAVAQGTVYADNVSTANAHMSATNGLGVLASLEAGYPIAAPFLPQLVLEPQAQILWQHVGFSQSYDGLSQVALGATNGATGRIGLLAESTVVADGGAVWKPYVRANLWGSWGGKAATTFGDSPDQVDLLEEASWLEFAGGATVKVNSRFSVYAQAGYQFATAPGNIRRNGYSGDFGLRYAW